jgi:electron transfer flavoprotein beta subunit
VDAGASATAVQVAALLDLPVISYVAELKSVEPDAARLTAVRLLENGRQRVSSRLPALITVVKEINEPRYPSFMGLRQAKKAVIPTWTLADLGLEAGQLQAQISWQVSAPPTREARLEILPGPPAAAAAALADRLIDDQVI